MKIEITRMFYLICCAALIIACALPWVHYNSINQTFNGYNVTKFTSGIYYGKAGVVITVIAILLSAFALGKTRTVQFITIFGTGLLIAYCVRTYLLFTGSLFEGETESRIGILMVLWIPFLMIALLLIPSRRRATSPPA